MVQYVRIRYRVQAVDTKFSVHSRARGRRYLTIGIIHSIYYMLDTVKSAVEFINSSLQVLRDSAAVHVCTAGLSHSKNLCATRCVKTPNAVPADD